MTTHQPPHTTQKTPTYQPGTAPIPNPPNPHTDLEPTAPSPDQATRHRNHSWHPTRPPWTHTTWWTTPHTTPPPPLPPTPPNPNPTTQPHPPKPAATRREALRRKAAAVWAWSVPGGDRLWAPILWAWRWRWTAAIAVGLLLWWGRVDVAGIVTACVVYLGACVALSAPAATQKRVASLKGVSVYRKRRRWIRSRWVEMMANASLIRAKAEGDTRKRLPELRAVRPHPHGVACRVDASHAGYGAAAFIGAGATIYNTVKARSVRVTRIETGRHAGDVMLTVKWDDPFPLTLRNSDIDDRLLEIEGERRWWFWRAHDLRLVPTQPVVGLDEEGWPTTLDVTKPILVVAASGHGKSTLLWQMLYALRKSGLPVLASVFDPKGGMELGELRDSAWRYVSRSADWPDFVAAESAALEADQLRAAREGLQDVPWDEDHPLRLIVVDELVTALMSSRGQEAKIVAFGMERTTQQALSVLMSQMRAANRSMAAMSTNAEKDVLGTARTMFPQTALGRVASTEKAAVDVMLGSGAHGAYPAHELDAKDPRMRGRFWMRVGGEVTYFRGVQLTAEERREVAVWMREQTEKYRARGFRDPVPARSVTQARAQARAQGAQDGVSGGGKASAKRSVAAVEEPAQGSAAGPAKRGARARTAAKAAPSSAKRIGGTGGEGE
jgi:hypothetical protein